MFAETGDTSFLGGILSCHPSQSHIPIVPTISKAGIKSTATVFEKIFNIGLKNIYDVCLYIKMRKTKLTRFLNKLTTGLTKELSYQH